MFDSVEVLGKTGQIPMAAIGHRHPCHFSLNAVGKHPGHRRDIRQRLQGVALPPFPGGDRIHLDDHALVLFVRNPENLVRTCRKLSECCLRVKAGYQLFCIHSHTAPVRVAYLARLFPAGSYPLAAPG